MRRLAVALAGLLAGCHPATSAQSHAPAAVAAPQSSAAEAPTAQQLPKPPTAVAQPLAATVATAAPASAHPAEAPPPTFVVRYACDDKYDADATCRPEKTAWELWLKGIDLSVAAANLLNHQGGGPSGAEWNPAAPLVVFVASRTEAGSARLKSSRTTFKPVARFSEYDVFLVSVTDWHIAARPARRGDFPDGAAWQPVRVVELHAVADGLIERGLFAFSSGE